MIGNRIAVLRSDRLFVATLTPRAMTIVGTCDIPVVAIEKVLRCGILKLTWALPKKDNRPIPSVSLKRLAKRMVELPIFGSSARIAEP
jgi:hypothetical protein